MNIERFFLSAFENRDYISRSKARIFLFYSFFMLLLLAMLMILYVIMPMDAVLARKGFIGGAGIIVLVIVSLAVLRSGNLTAAVWSYALPTMLVAVALRFINSRTAPETAFSTYIFYLPYLIVYTAVFGKRWHVPVVTLFFFTANVLVYLMIRNVTGVLTATISTGIINSTMGLLTTGVIAYSLVNIMDKYIITLEKEAQTAAAKVERIRGAMTLAHDGLHVGSDLLSESESMAAAAGAIERSIGDIRREVVSLRGDVDNTARTNDGIVSSTAILTRSTESYQAMTLQASSAVEEMTASIESITAVSTRNRDSVESLASSIAEGIETADSSAKTISSLTESSKSLQDVVEVISAISSQTNLLAMNAAIEAAHAGDSGKGFAVVADEIRRLAEETASNSRTISDGLGRFFQQISEAETANHQIEAAFQQIGREISGTRSAFEEIISGMRELSVGTKDINRSVSDVVTASREMTESIQGMNGMIGTNSGSIEAVREKTARTLSSLETITSSFTDILSRAGTVRNLGQRSDEVIRDLDESIRAI